MGLKLYFDYTSQPSRALYIFLKMNNIPFESEIIDLRAGDQFVLEYKNVNPFRKVPVIKHDDFLLTESIAILRYLSREFNVPDHWYPKDSKMQARVDTFLEWNHTNTRLNCGMFFRVKALLSIREGRDATPSEIATQKSLMEQSLDQLENIWLKDQPYLAGDAISVADLIGTCEIEQPRMAGYNPRMGRPKLTAWMDRVMKDTSPFYQEAHTTLNKIAKKYEQKVKSQL